MASTCCPKRKKRKSKKKLCVCSSKDSDSSEDSSFSLESCEELKRTCPKKRLNDIPPEFLSMISSSIKNKKISSKAACKTKNQRTRKPLQERLKKKYPIPNPCNIICLCQQEEKPKYSETTIRKVPPQPVNEQKTRKLKRRLPKSKKSLITHTEDSSDDCMQFLFKKDNQENNLESCCTAYEENSCNQMQTMQFANKNENRNKKLFKSRTIMTDDYATFDCIQIEIESEDDASGCNCQKLEEKQLKEKQVQTNPTKENNEKQSTTSMKESKQKLSPEDEKNNEKQTKTPQVEPDKPTILKRCICLVKKHNNQKKPQNTKEETCDRTINNPRSNNTSLNSECCYESEEIQKRSNASMRSKKSHSECYESEEILKRSNASMKCKKSDVDENCGFSQYSERGSVRDTKKHSNIEQKCSTSTKRNQDGHNPSNRGSLGPQNIEIHIGKSNAKITIIRDLD